MKQSVTIEVELDLKACTDEEILEEADARGIFPEEKGVSDFDDAEIDAEYMRRFVRGGTVATLEEVYEEFRTRGDAPPILRDYIYQTIDRILP